MRAAQLRGIGWGKAKAIADSGACVGEMVGWSPERWREIEGIGEVLGESIHNELWGIR
jgi:hypothetical protein